MIAASSTVPTDFRSQRGLALAQMKRDAIKPIVGTKWLVPSATSTGGYVVDTQEGTCSCPDWIKLGGHGQPHRCKHIWAAILIVRLPDGIGVIVEERQEYDRDWRAINWARTAIPRLGPGLIVELVDGLGLEPPVGGKRGAPRVPESDILKVALLRTFEEKTAGEAEVAAENYQTLGVQIGRVPSYNTLLREFARPSLMPHYHRLLAGSSLACIGLEKTFAVDGTGFGTSRFDCHRTHKHGTKAQRQAEEQRYAEMKRHRWLEAKLVFGVDTLIIPAAQITEPHVSEGPLMQELLRRTIANGGRVTTWCGDAAYLSWYNIEAVERVIAKVPAKAEVLPGGKLDPATSTAPWRIYNIGNNRSVEVPQVVTLLEQEFGRKAKVELGPMQPGDVPETCAEIDDLMRDVGFRPATPIEDGVRKFVAWYRQYHH